MNSTDIVTIYNSSKDSAVGMDENIIISLISIGAGAIIKYVYDKYVTNKQERTQEINKHHMYRYAKSLELFYWPIYTRLCKFVLISSELHDYGLNDNLILEETMHTHEEIIDIIRKNMHLSEPTEDFYKTYAHYLHYVSNSQSILYIYKKMESKSMKDYDIKLKQIKCGFTNDIHKFTKYPNFYKALINNAMYNSITDQKEQDSLFISIAIDNVAKNPNEALLLDDIKKDISNISDIMYKNILLDRLTGNNPVTPNKVTESPRRKVRRMISDEYKLEKKQIDEIRAEISISNAVSNITDATSIAINMKNERESDNELRVSRESGKHRRSLSDRPGGFFDKDMNIRNIKRTSIDRESVYDGNDILANPMGISVTIPSNTESVKNKSTLLEIPDVDSPIIKIESPKKNVYVYKHLGFPMTFLEKIEKDMIITQNKYNALMGREEVQPDNNTISFSILNELHNIVGDNINKLKYAHVHYFDK